MMWIRKSGKYLKSPQTLKTFNETESEVILLKDLK
jgi:hypothetical protein